MERLVRPKHSEMERVVHPKHSEMERREGGGDGRPNSNGYLSHRRSEPHAAQGGDGSGEGGAEGREGCGGNAGERGM